jgi:hypothetical protein
MGVRKLYGSEALRRFKATEANSWPITNQLDTMSVAEYHGIYETYKLYALMRKPRSCVGEISDRYRGIVDWSIPTPIPENSFATSQWSQCVAKDSMKTL